MNAAASLLTRRSLPRVGNVNECFARGFATVTGRNFRRWFPPVQRWIDDPPVSINFHQKFSINRRSFKVHLQANY